MSPRYVPLVKIASGGMATVYVGALRGDLGFQRLVAIKRPHPHLAEDPDFRAALLEEARVAARVRHAHVASVLDMEVAGDDVQLVMDYIEGATLSQLLAAASKRGEKLPPGVALRVALDACAGLAAVHEARDEHGRPLGLVHRDVSPQNILVGLDGLARISDFGTAKSAQEGRPSTTQGTLKGKLAYMAPEYVGRGRLDTRADVFAMGVVLWEALAGKRLFRGANDADTLDRVQREEAPPLSELAPELGASFDEPIARALVKRPEDRWPTVEALAAVIAAVAGERRLIASHVDVARVVRSAVEPDLEARRAEVRARLAGLDAAPTSRPVVPSVVAPEPAAGAPPIRAAAALPEPATAALPELATAALPEPATAALPELATETQRAPWSGASPEPTARSAERGRDEETAQGAPRAGRRWLLAVVPVAAIAAVGGVLLARAPGGGVESPAASPVTVTSAPGPSIEVAPAAPSSAPATVTTAPGSSIDVAPAAPSSAPATVTTAPGSSIDVAPAAPSSAPAGEGSTPAETGSHPTKGMPDALPASREATPAPARAVKPTSSSGAGAPPPASTGASAAPAAGGKRKAPPNPYGP